MSKKPIKISTLRWLMGVVPLYVGIGLIVGAIAAILTYDNHMWAYTWAALNFSIASLAINIFILNQIL